MNVSFCTAIAAIVQAIHQWHFHVEKNKIGFKRINRIDAFFRSITWLFVKLCGNWLILE